MKCPYCKGMMLQQTSGLPHQCIKCRFIAFDNTSYLYTTIINTSYAVEKPYVEKSIRLYEIILGEDDRICSWGRQKNNIIDMLTMSEITPDNINEKLSTILLFQ